MVGKAVLIECLENNLVGKILIINRQKVGLTHPKIKEILLSDFSKLNSIKTISKIIMLAFIVWEYLPLV